MLVSISASQEPQGQRLITVISDIHLGLGRHSVTVPEANIPKFWKVRNLISLATQIKLIRSTGSICNFSSLRVRDFDHQTLYPAILPEDIHHSKIPFGYEYYRICGSCLVDCGGASRSFLLPAYPRVLEQENPIQMCQTNPLLRWCCRTKYRDRPCHACLACSHDIRSPTIFGSEDRTFIDLSDWRVVGDILAV